MLLASVLVWSGFANIAVFPFVFVQCLTPDGETVTMRTFSYLFDEFGRL
jgi:hypothetical protein